MRKLTSHKVNKLNEQIEVLVLDEPGSGGANHQYALALDPLKAPVCRINFQNGPILEAGINGISNEALLAILIDRLEGFQSGKFACNENMIALTKLVEAMHWLHHRTRERISRCVEGTHAQ